MFFLIIIFSCAVSGIEMFDQPQMFFLRYIGFIWFIHLATIYRVITISFHTTKESLSLYEETFKLKWFKGRPLAK